MPLNGRNQINKNTPIILGIQTVDPTTTDEGGALYFKKVGDKTELFFRGYDSTGGAPTTPVQITSNGIVLGSGGSSFQFLSGGVAPADIDGNDGDIYLNTANGDIYSKSGGTWGAPIMNIQGSDGANGSDGADGQGVATGGNTGQILKKQSNADFDTAWESEATALVSSVNSQTGVVVLTTDSISEGTQKYDPADVSAPEIAAGTESANRSWSPAEIKSMIDTHGGGGGATNEFVVTLGAGSDLATRLASGDTVVPAGWSVSDGTSAAVAGIHQGAEDLVITHSLGLLPMTVTVWQLRDSGPAAVQRQDFVEFDAASQIKADVALNNFSLSDLQTPTDGTFKIRILIKLLAV